MKVVQMSNKMPTVAPTRDPAEGQFCSGTYEAGVRRRGGYLDAIGQSPSHRGSFLTNIAAAFWHFGHGRAFSAALLSPFGYFTSNRGQLTPDARFVDVRGAMGFALRALCRLAAFDV